MCHQFLASTAYLHVISPRTPLIHLMKFFKNITLYYLVYYFILFSSSNNLIILSNRRVLNMIHYNYRRYLLFASVQLILFITITFMVKNNFQPFIAFENVLTNFTQQFIGTPAMNYAGNFINDSMTFFATYGDATPLVILTIIIAGILFLKHYNFLAFWVLGVVSTGGLVGVFLKQFIQRGRPINHLPLDDGFSFPSGHAVGSSLFFGVLIFVLLPRIKNKSLKTIGIGLCLLAWFSILSSRIYFSAHHLGDILAGVTFGLFWVFSAIVVYCWSAAWFQRYIFKKSMI